MTVFTPARLSDGRARAGAPGRASLVAGISALLLALMVLTATPVGSAESCGDHSFGFEGTRLINDGISTSAGPFSITLPAGNYAVTLVSNDNHPSADYQTAQTQEQWYVRLDNGYVSMPANDIPNDAEDMVTTFPAEPIEAASSISVHHLEEGTSPNSVNVVCVGFTAVEVSPPTVAPPTSVAPPSSAVAPPSSAVAPPSSAVAPPTTAPPAVVATTVVPTTAPPQVAGAVVTQPPPPARLAVTGAESSRIALLAAAGIALGALLLAFAESRRSSLR